MSGRHAPAGPDDYGACRCCGRWFTAHPIDRETEARHEGDGYCGGCVMAARRAGTIIPPCRHGIPASSYRCGFTTEQNRRHLEDFLHRIAGTSERTPPVVDRARVLENYVCHTDGHIIRAGDTYGGQSPDLANDYLQHLTGDATLHIPGHAIEWSITAEELTRSAQALLTIADYTTAYPGRHTRVELPITGDVMCFAGPPGNPYGALGLYVGHDRDRVVVYTQGASDGQMLPAQLAEVDPTIIVPVGWWRVRPESLVHPKGPLPWKRPPSLQEHA